MAKFRLLTLALVSAAMMGCSPSPVSSSQSDVPFSSSQEDVPASSSSETPSSSSSSSSSSTSIEDEPGKEYNVSSYYDGYYSSLVSWKDGEDLKKQLHKIISTGFNGLTYDDPNWESNQFADQDLDDHTKVEVLYSATDFLKTETSNAGKGWQKEHSFCATLMTGYPTSEAVNVRSSGYSRATDFHNLFAAYGSGNSARGNKNFGYAEAGSTGGAAELADYIADSENFEPNVTDRGRLARAIFYMGVMYSVEETSSISSKISYTSGGSSKSKTVTINAKYKPLEITEEYAHYNSLTLSNFCLKTGVWQDDITYEQIRTEYMGTSSTLDLARIDETTYVENFTKAYAEYKYETTPFAIGNLSTLLEWNNYSVDRLEMQHNESVYSHVYAKRNVAQGNRNPFIDYPQLVEYVYGSKKNEAGELKYLKPTEYVLNTGSNDKHSYSVTSYKDTYRVGDTWSLKDVTLIGNEYDFSTFDLSNEEYNSISSLNPDYTFKASDEGNKTISIKTNLGEVKYNIKVEGDAQGIESCSFYHIFTGYTDPSYTFYGYGEKGTDNVYNYCGKENPITLANDSLDGPVSIDMTAYWKTGRIASYSEGTGVTFGAQSKGKTNQPCELISFTTVDSVKVSSVYIKGNTGSGKSYTLNVYVGNEKLYTGTFKKEADLTTYGISFDKVYEGKVKIEFTNVNGTVIINAVGINIIN